VTPCVDSQLPTEASQQERLVLRQFVGRRAPGGGRAGLGAAAAGRSLVRRRGGRFVVDFEFGGSQTAGPAQWQLL
jgi:hypothetical protein